MGVRFWFGRVVLLVILNKTEYTWKIRMSFIELCAFVKLRDNRKIDDFLQLKSWEVKEGMISGRQVREVCRGGVEAQTLDPIVTNNSSDTVRSIFTPSTLGGGGRRILASIISSVSLRCRPSVHIPSRLNEISLYYGIQFYIYIYIYIVGRKSCEWAFSHWPSGYRLVNDSDVSC